MNFARSRCTKCKGHMMVNQAEWNDKHAHVCGNCYNTYLLMRSRHNQTLLENEADESEFEVDELELDLYNDFSYLDTPGYEQKSCQCGAVIAKTPWHAGWCPVFEDPMTGKTNTTDGEEII